MSSVLSLSTALLVAVASCSAKVARVPAIDDTGSGGASGGSAPADAGAVKTGDAAAGPSILASGLAFPSALAASGSAVYFALSGASDAGPAGSIARVSKQGGAVEVIVADVDTPVAVAASSSAVCYATRPASGLGGVYCASLPSGPVVTLALGEEGLGGLIIKSAYVYWTSALSGTLVERSLVTGGGTSTVTAVSGACAPAGLAVEAGYVYFACSGGQAGVYSALASASAAEPLVSPSLALYGDVVSGGTRVVVARFGSPSQSALLSVPKLPGPTSLAASNLGPPAHLAGDGAFVYWTSPADGAVYATPLGASALPPRTVASGLSAPLAIAVDDAVYFSTASALQRVPLAQ